MLVDAAAHPGPAIFQGIGLILVSIWAIWLNWTSDEERRRDAQYRKLIKNDQHHQMKAGSVGDIAAVVGVILFVVFMFGAIGVSAIAMGRIG